MLDWRSAAVKPRDLLLAACLLCAVVATIALVRAAEWTAAHWVLIAAGVIVLGGLAMVLHYAQRIAAVQASETELHYRDQVQISNWVQPGKHEPWPKWCAACGLPADDWQPMAAHDTPQTSPCARDRAIRAAEPAPASVHAEQVPAAPGKGWPAVLPDLEGDE